MTSSYLGTFIAWPDDDRASLLKLLENFGDEIITEEEFASGEFKERDSRLNGWNVALWKVSGWQLILFPDQPSYLLVPWINDFDFPFICWELRSADFETYNISVSDVHSVEVDIHVRNGFLVNIFGAESLGPLLSWLHKTERKTTNDFLIFPLRLLYLVSLPFVTLPKTLRFPENATARLSPFPGSFTVFENGIETLKGLGVPESFYPIPTENGIYLWFG